MAGTIQTLNSPSRRREMQDLVMTPVPPCFFNGLMEWVKLAQRG